MEGFFFHYHDIMYLKLDYNLYNRIFIENKKIFFQKSNLEETEYRLELFTKFMKNLFNQYKNKNIIVQQSVTEQMTLSILHFNIKIFIGLIYLKNIHNLKKLEKISLLNIDFIRLRDIIKFYNNEKKYSELYPLITNLFDKEIIIEFENELISKKKYVNKIYNFYKNYKNVRNYRLGLTTITCLYKKFPQEICNLIIEKINGYDELNFYHNNIKDIDLILDQCKLSKSNQNIIIVVRNFIKYECDVVDTIINLYESLKIE